MLDYLKTAKELGISAEGKSVEELKDLVAEALSEKNREYASRYEDGKELQEFKTAVAETRALVEEARAMGKTNAELKELVEKCDARVDECEKQIKRRVTQISGEPPPYKVKHLVGMSPEALQMTPAKDLPILRDWQEAVAQYAVVRGVFRNDREWDGDMARSAPRTMKRLSLISRDLGEMLRKAGEPMGAGVTGIGEEWIPTVLASEVLDGIYREQLRVVGLFRQVTHPPRTPVWEYPIDLGEAVALPETEQTTHSATFIPASGPTNPTTGKRTLTAKKYAVKVNYTGEFLEDSIIPVVPHLQEKIARAMAEGEENGLINGDVAATHMDFDIEDAGAADMRLDLWAGIRAFAIDASATHDAGGDAAGLADLQAALKGGGKFFLRRDRTAIIMSNSSYWNLMTEASSPLVDASQLGAAVPLVTGQIGAVYGIPIFTSPFVREDVSADGTNDETGPNTFTTINVVNLDQAIMGSYRPLTVEAWRHPFNDTYWLMGRKRGSWVWYHDAGATIEYNRLIYNLTLS